MKSLLYRNTKTTLPSWTGIHEQQPRGIAYETDDHFVHIYGRADGLWTVSNGLTVTKGKEGSLADWVKESFGAEEIIWSEMDVGTTKQGIWRPGLYYDKDVLEGLGEKDVNLRFAEQSLLLLVEKLDELLLFVEPTGASLQTYGHKSRELLILACTEVEGQWRQYLIDGGMPHDRRFTTNDYFSLRDPLRLSEYEISLPRYGEVPPITPFRDWTADRPTQSLAWYDAYNKTKHDRKDHFFAATLISCIEAIAANIVMFAVRFGPFRLHQGGGMLSALFNPQFSIALRNCNPASFYTPNLDLAGRNQGLSWGHANTLPSTPLPFRL